MEGTDDSLTLKFSRFHAVAPEAPQAQHQIFPF
jgi:hypothetical protein